MDMREVQVGILFPEGHRGADSVIKSGLPPPPPLQKTGYGLVRYKPKYLFTLEELMS